MGSFAVRVRVELCVCHVCMSYLFAFVEGRILPYWSAWPEFTELRDCVLIMHSLRRNVCMVACMMSVCTSHTHLHCSVWATSIHACFLNLQGKERVCVGVREKNMTCYHSAPLLCNGPYTLYVSFARTHAYTHA